MRAYSAVLKARIRVLLQYRAAALAGLGTQLFWGLIRVMIFAALYRGTQAAQPMTYEQAVSYLWLVQAFLLLMPFRVDQEIRQIVRDGSLAYELVRPTDLYWYWFSRALAARTAPVLLRGAPILLIAGFFLGLQLPPSWASALAWVLSLAGAVALSSAWGTLLSISLLWTISGEGIGRLLTALAFLLSGALIPLPLFPEWSQRALDLLPFRGLMDIPLRIYIGHFAPQQVLALVGHQVAWCSVVIIVGRLLLARGLRRVVVQGG